MRPFRPLTQLQIARALEAGRLIRTSTAVPCTACCHCGGCPEDIAIPEYFSLYNQLSRLGKERCGNMPGWSKAETWHQPAPAAGGADRQLSCPEKAGGRRCPRICRCRPRLCESHVKEFAGIPHAAAARRLPAPAAGAAGGIARRYYQGAAGGAGAGKCVTAVNNVTRARAYCCWDVT